MLAKYKHFWHVAPIATALLSISIILLVVFTLRLTVFFLRPPPPRDMTIQPWMTPGFVAHSWHVPPDVMAAVLQIDASKGGRMQNLDHLATERGIPVEELIKTIESAIAEFRSQENSEK